jgi:hypothetical protein
MAQKPAPEPHNPKTDPEPGSNTVKDPKDWTTGDEPMTGAQASYLKTLSEESGEAFEEASPRPRPRSRSTSCATRLARATTARGRSPAQAAGWPSMAGGSVRSRLTSSLLSACT